MAAETVVTSFYVMVPSIRRVGIDRPWTWLAAGWRDLTRAPVQSLTLGLVFAVVGWLLTFGLWWVGLLYLVLPLASGFMIVGPILAIELYELSRRLDAGEAPSFRGAFAAFRRNPRHIAVMCFVLLLILLTWIRIAAMIFMLYWGLEPPSFEELVVNTFLSGSGWWVGRSGAGLRVIDSGVPMLEVVENMHNHSVTVQASKYFGAYVRDWRPWYCANKAAS